MIIMSQKPPAYIANPDLLTRLLAVLEDWQWSRLLFHLAGVINGTGWGEIHITIKGGKLDQIDATQHDKPRKPD